MVELLFDPAVWVSLMALTVMEIVLGIDNVVFISLVIAKLKPEQREIARKIGLSLALILRIILLLMITWVISLKQPVIEFMDYKFSWRDIILIAGGLFLLAKATTEIHNDVEGDGEDTSIGVMSAFYLIIMQIIVIDLVFSIDSIITAIGMTPHVEIMIAAVIMAVIVMYFASKQISLFIEEHPTTKVLALSFLLLIGAALIADGFQVHIPRGYIYFAMAYAAFIEFLNIRRKTKVKAN